MKVKAYGILKLTLPGKYSIDLKGKQSFAYQDPSSGLWWAKDTTGHGGSVYKVFRKVGNELHWVTDADQYGDYIADKHKSTTGTVIKIK